MDDRDLFSYDNSGNLENNGEASFDLNSFSSHNGKNGGNKKSKRKGKRKDRILRAVLTVFLVGLITVSIVISAFLLS